MIDYIDAPVPYIIGIPKQIWEGIDKKRQLTLCSEAIIYDIDERNLLSKSKIPKLPESIINTMQKEIIKILLNTNTKVIFINIV